MKPLRHGSGSKKKWLRISVASLIALVIVLTVYAIIMRGSTTETSNTAPLSKDARPISLQSTALYTGNTFWGRYMNDWSMASPLKTAYPFSRLGEFDRSSYDAWVTGLECPTVENFSQTSAQEDATLSFNCSPEYLPEAAKWFTVVTLANNHTDNRGVAGFEETKQHLEENGIQYFGHYDANNKADTCEVIALPVTVTYDDEQIKHQKLPVAMCGFHGVFGIPSADTMSIMKQYAEVMPVIAMPHMGAEYTETPDKLKVATYRAMIDNGADMVLGDHPHWIQTTEAYKGKLIVYSMGNFIFDQQANKEVTRSGTIKVVMKTTNASSEQLQKWLALGEKCASFKDTCLQEATADSLSKLPFEYRFGVIGTNSANKITKPATQSETNEILDRMKWSETMSQLQSPQGSL